MTRTCPCGRLSGETPAEACGCLEWGIVVTPFDDPEWAEGRIRELVAKSNHEIVSIERVTRKVTDRDQCVFVRAVSRPHNCGWPVLVAPDGEVRSRVHSTSCSDSQHCEVVNG